MLTWASPSLAEAGRSCWQVPNTRKAVQAPSREKWLVGGEGPWGGKWQNVGFISSISQDQRLQEAESGAGGEVRQGGRPLWRLSGEGWGDTSLSTTHEGEGKRHVQRLLLCVGLDRGKDTGKVQKIKTHSKRAALMSQENVGPTDNKE